MNGPYPDPDDPQRLYTEGELGTKCGEKEIPPEIMLDVSDEDLYVKSGFEKIRKLNRFLAIGVDFDDVILPLISSSTSDGDSKYLYKV